MYPYFVPSTQLSAYNSIIAANKSRPIIVHTMTPTFLKGVSAKSKTTRTALEFVIDRNFERYRNLQLVYATGLR